LCAGSLFEVFEKALGKTEMNLPRKEKEKLKEEIVAGQYPREKALTKLSAWALGDQGDTDGPQV
jgi:hypothetical protein